METKTKKIVIISGIVAGLILIYWFFIRTKKTDIPATTPATPGANTTQPGGNSGAVAKNLPNADFPLKSGSYGQQVQHIQIALNLQHGAALATDGRMGPATLAAINKNYPQFKGTVSYVNYMMIFNRYGVQIMNFLKLK